MLMEDLKMGLRQRLKAACEKDSNIVVAADKLSAHPGFTTDYMTNLGLTKQDLKKLEHVGAAKRGYTRNCWLPGETLPNGKIASGKNEPSGELTRIPTGVPVRHPSYRERTKQVIIQGTRPTIRTFGRGHSLRWVLVSNDVI
jgi:hypothetical protein